MSDEIQTENNPKLTSLSSPKNSLSHKSQLNGSSGLTSPVRSVYQSSEHPSMSQKGLGFSRPQSSERRASLFKSPEKSKFSNLNSPDARPNQRTQTQTTSGFARLINRPNVIKRTESRSGSFIGGKQEDDSDSRSDATFASLMNVQEAYQKVSSPLKNVFQKLQQRRGQNLSHLKISSRGSQRKDSIFSGGSIVRKVHRTYYDKLRRVIKWSRSNSKKEDYEPPEFQQQIEEYEENITVPDTDKIRDLQIVERTSLEKLKHYHDRFPLLKFRKKILKLMRYISLFCYKVITNSFFDHFILCVIITNSVLLALYDPITGTSGEPNSVDDFLLGVYTAEMTLKIFGLGFILHKKSYLRDPWNVMDFVIVVTAYIPYIVSSSTVNLQALRSLRVLRPLRTISNITALRVLIVTLLGALPSLMETLLILGFLFVIFAIAGLQLFSGLMKKRCFSLDMGVPQFDITISEANYQKYCNSDDDCGRGLSGQFICGKMIANPNYGITNFDNILYSFLMVFQSVTTEGWTQIMIILQQTFSPLVAIYFIFLIFMGAFFLLNLTLAVIKAEFTAQSHEKITSHIHKHIKSEETKIQEKLTKHKLELVSLIRSYNQGKLSDYKYKMSKNAVKVLEKGEKVTKRRRSKKHSLIERINGIRQTFLKRNTTFRFTFSRLKSIFSKNKDDSPKLRGSFRNSSKATISTPDITPTKRHGSLSTWIHSLNKSKDRSSIALMTQEADLSPLGKTATPKEHLKQDLMEKKANSNVDIPNNKSNTFHIRKIHPSPKVSILTDQNNSLMVLKQTEIINTQDTTQNAMQSQSQSFGLLRKSSFTKEPLWVQPVMDYSTSAKSPKGFREIPCRKAPVVIEEISSSEEIITTRRDNDLLDRDIILARKTAMETVIKKTGRGDSTLRPMLSSKVEVKDDDNKTAVNMVNIAGIRGTFQPKEEKAQRGSSKGESSSRKELDKKEMLHEKEHQFKEGDLLADLTEVSAPPITNEKPVQKTQETNLLFKMNQVKNHTLSYGRMPTMNYKTLFLKKYKSISNASFQLTEFSHNNGDLSGVPFTPRDLSIQDDLIEDSDFFEQEFQAPALRRQKTMNRKKAKKKLAWGRTMNDKEETENDQEKSEDSQEEDELWNDEEEEEHFINLRRLKAEVYAARDYVCNSLDDVLPIKKELEKKLKEDREIQLIKNTKLPREFKLTATDERLRDERSSVKQETRRTIALREDTVGRSSMKGNSDLEKHTKFSSKLEEAQWNSFKGKDVEVMNDNDQDDVRLSKNPYKRVSTRRTKRKDENNEGDDGLNEMELQNFEVVLRVINKEIKDQSIKDENEKLESFQHEKDYLNIRRSDLEKSKIADRNWSGISVVGIITKSFPMDIVKKALNNFDPDIWRPGFFGVLHAIRRKLRMFIASNLFNNFIMLSVLINTAILASNGLVTANNTLSAFNVLNTLFTAVFSFEMTIKISALGVVGYMKDRINLFDAIIVLISLVEAIFLTDTSIHAISAFRAVRLLRTFRILRVTKLLRSLAYMQIIIGVVMRSIKKFIYIAALLFLLIFIYALLGMQIFGGQFSFSDNIGDDRVRQNFDSFINAFMAVFQIMTQENWQQILFFAMRSSVSKVFSIFYLLSWIFIGNYVFLNLFLAILLDEFTGEETEEDLQDIKYDQSEDEAESLKETTMNPNSSTPKNMFINNSKRKKSADLLKELDIYEEFEEPSKVRRRLVPFDGIACQRSFFLFSQNNLMRRCCWRIVKHPYFETVILVLIVTTSVKLALDTFIPNSATQLLKISFGFNIFFNSCFMFEAVLKIITLGFVLDKNSYLRDTWNILDFIIVIASILDMSIAQVNISFIRVLRLLRTLRPLRFISHNKSMRLVVTALIESIGPIFNVLIVVMIIWLMFAILAVNIIGGDLSYCTNLPSGVSMYGIGRSQCLLKGHVWANYNANFDNVFNGMLTLFILSTQENWPDIMYHMADSNDPSEGPLPGANAAFAYIFLVVFLIIGSYFLINLFVGVIFLNFTRAQKAEDHLATFLTTKQHQWVIMQQLILKAKPDTSNIPPSVDWQKPFFKLFNSIGFDLAIMICILLNVLVMALSYEGSSDVYANNLKYINWTFSFIFVAEMIIKHLGLGFKRYWKSPWNQFDAFVVVASIVDILLDILNQSLSSFVRVGPQLARVFRVLRVSRLFKLVKKSEGLQKIINTLVFSLPSLLNVGALLSLVYFIYAILGTFLFSDIKAGDIIDGYVNFVDFSASILVLFRASTGEDWWTIMFDTMNATVCYSGTPYCGTKVAPVFWISYIVICQFIFLNLFILVILQQFEDYHLKPDNPITRYNRDLEKVFRPNWSVFSMKHGGLRIYETQLIDFFMEMRQPFGFKNAAVDKRVVAKEILKLGIPIDFEGMVTFNDLLFAVFKLSYGNEDKMEISEFLVREERRTTLKLDKMRQKTITIKSQTSLKRSNSIKIRNGQMIVNPLLRMLFIGMTTNAWKKYAQRVQEKEKEAKANGHEYIDSESEIDDDASINSHKSNDLHNFIEESQNSLTPGLPGPFSSSLSPQLPTYSNPFSPGFVHENFFTEERQEYKDNKIVQGDNVDQFYEAGEDENHVQREEEINVENNVLIQNLQVIVEPRESVPESLEIPRGGPPNYYVCSIAEGDESKNEDQITAPLQSAPDSVEIDYDHMPSRMESVGRSREESRSTKQRLFNFMDKDLQLMKKESTGSLHAESRRREKKTDENNISRVTSIINVNVKNNIYINNNYYIKSPSKSMDEDGEFVQVTGAAKEKLEKELSTGRLKVKDVREGSDRELSSNTLKEPRKDDSRNMLSIKSSYNELADDVERKSVKPINSKTYI